MFKKTIVLVVMVAVVIFMTLPAPAADKLIFKLGTVDTANSHSGVGAEAFASEVARLSNGSMEVKVFHAGKLGNIPVQQTNVINGAQDMHLVYPEFLSQFFEEAKVISLPYLFNDLNHIQTFYTSDLWGGAMEKLEKQGAIVLDKEWTWWVKDPRGFISVRPIFTPKDLSGFKMRIWEAKAAIETWKGFGANPIVVPRPEMYLAFSQKIIEGGPETIGVSYDQKNAEMAKYWIRTQEYYQIINIMMNKKKYDSLTPEQKDILHQATMHAGKVFTAATQKNWETKKRKANLELGVSVIEPALKPWRKAGKITIERLAKDGFISESFIEKINGLAK